jgi:hypothetical protein
VYINYNDTDESPSVWRQALSLMSPVSFAWTAAAKHASVQDITNTGRRWTTCCPTASQAALEADEHHALHGRNGGVYLELGAIRAPKHVAYPAANSCSGMVVFANPGPPISFRSDIFTLTE